MLSLFPAVLIAAAIAASVDAATKTFNWEMSYITASPNGVSRPVIGVNGAFPPPTIYVSKNDNVVIHVKNSLNDGEFITLHTHGVFQNGTNYYDGVDQVTQWYTKYLLYPENSGIPPGDTFEYNFNVGDQTGTYWIHSHIKGQYPNGLRAPFVILDPDSPYNCYDDIVLSVSDWYNETMQVLIPQFMSPENADGAEPVPDGALMWDTQNGTTTVTPGSTVRFRVVNVGAFGFFHLWIEDHLMTVVEVDGIDVVPFQTQGIDVAVGQRYSVLVTMTGDANRNYPIVGAMDQDMFDSPSAAPNVTSWLIYNPSAPKPKAKLVSEFFDFDDTDLIPLKAEPPVNYDTLVTALVDFTSINGINYAIINNNTYQPPTVPAMFTALTTGKDADSLSVYGNLTNTFIVNHLDMVWLVINNDDDGSHPFHLHGHAFQVLYRSDVNASHFDPENVPKFPANPVRRDVILVKSKGYAILAFRADNPGAWFLYLHVVRSVNGSHCHIDWHVVAGMVAQFIEAPLEMQKRLTVPNQISQQCKEAGIPTSGPNV